MKRKRSEEVAIQQQKNLEIFEKQVEEAGKALRLERQRHDHEVEQLKADIIGQDNILYRKQIKYIENCGMTAERLGIFVNTSKIMTRLRQKFKPWGVNNRSSVYYEIAKRHKDWIDQSHVHVIGTNSKGNKGGQQTPPLTKQEEQYLEAYENEMVDDKYILTLLEHWTGKDYKAQGRILAATPKHESWRRHLIEQSKDHMFKVVKQYTPDVINHRINDIRTLTEVASVFSDILYEEREIRERNKELSSV